MAQFQLIWSTSNTEKRRDLFVHFSKGHFFKKKLWKIVKIVKKFYQRGKSMQNCLRNPKKLVSSWYFQPFLSYSAFNAGLKKYAIFWNYFMHWERLLPPLILCDFDKIWTVASLHCVLLQSKISWHLNNVKMPKIDLKVENRQIKFLKNQFLCGKNAKLCRGGVNHDPKFFVGIVGDLQKKIQLLFSILCLPKKNKLKSLLCAKC